MPRVKRGKTTRRKHKRILKRAKGYLGGRHKQVKRAKEALLKADSQAYRGRKKRKREYRRLWQIRLNAAVREHDLSYSRFIHGLKKAKIELDRKVLSDLAMNHKPIFKEIVKAVKDVK